MCKSCRRKIKRRVTTVLLTPALIFSQPVLTQLDAIFESATAPGVETALSLVDALIPKAHAASSNDEAAPVKWTCPMHPHYIADEFGTCPICGMDLVKLETGNDPMNEASAENRTVVTVAPEVMQNMGVRLAKAEQSQFGRSIRSFGIVTENERRQLEITSRVEGWIEELKVTAVGDEVKKGDLLFKLYSPQLIVSQNNYLSPGTADLGGRGLAQLRSLGVQDKALEEIKSLQRPIDQVPFYADRDGTVSVLNLRQGTYVQRGMMMAKIQDYSTVWLIVGVAEKDLGFVSADTSAKVTFPSLPGREVTAKVDYVYPTVDMKTRTGQVRLVVDNPDGLIRPGSYADVSFEVGIEQRVAVPSESILKSGEGRHVVVSLGQGRFEPRAIEAGLVSGAWTEVKSGVKPGEDIVVSGQFLLDSESALRESFRKLERLQLPLSLIKLDGNQFAMIDHMVDAALYLHEALIDGYGPDPKFLDPAISIRDLMWPRFKDTKLAFVLEDSASALRDAQKARTISETEAALAKLVSALRPWLMDGAPDHYREKKVALFKEKNGERLWLQKDGKPLNPYASGAGEQIPWPETGNPSTADAGGDAQSERLASKARKN